MINLFNFIFDISKFYTSVLLPQIAYSIQEQKKMITFSAGIVYRYLDFLSS